MSELVRDHEATFLTVLDQVEEMRPEKTDLVEDDSPQYRRSRLFLESLLRRSPPADERIYLGHQAAMNPAPYQLTPASMALSALRPRILIADGVGIGKTLEAGVLLSELIKRGRGDRILVVVLKSLLTQFQQELWTRFSIPLVRLDSIGLQRVRARIPANKNPFYYFNRAIISIDTLKNDGRYRTFLEDCKWDVIVIDECHHVANADTQRNRLASLLARTCDSLILTSATPHNGKPESFANLMNMLDPTAIANPLDYSRDEIKGLFVRRFKKDVSHEVGEHFREREAMPLPVFTTDREEGILKRLKGLQFHTLNKKNKRGRDILFRTTLFKAFLSSPHACLETVENRLKTIDEKLNDAPVNRSDLESDWQILDMLYNELQQVVEQPCGKVKALFKWLDSIGWTGLKDSPRVLLFSERICTLKMLRHALASHYDLRDEAITLFHAALSDTEQMSIVEDFGKKDAPVRILLATDVASEGVNLHHFCHHLVHFDIPWSLITLEQRNGRIDRYGQNENPIIVYLTTRTDDPSLRGDMHILKVLVEKERYVYKNIGDATTLTGIYSAEEEAEVLQGELDFGGNPEDIYPEEPEDLGILSLLLDSELAAPPPPEDTGITLSLYENDLSFLRAAFDELCEENSDLPYPDFYPDHPSVEMAMPEDLQRRFHFVPREAWPKNNKLFLTSDRQRVQDAIADARRLSKEELSTWPDAQLLWELHPAMQWLLDKVICRFQRHEAPVICTGKLSPDNSAWLFQGILSNRRSQPVIVDWFVIRYQSKRFLGIQPLKEFLDTSGFLQGLPNRDYDTEAVETLQEQRQEVVDKALEHLAQLRGRRIRELEERLQEDNKRFDRWRRRSMEKIELDRFMYGGDTGRLRRDIAERLRKEENRVEAQSKIRKEWLRDSLEVVERPYLKLTALFIGTQ
jgi:superfamily II DNA or RNA helicase